MRRPWPTITSLRLNNHSRHRALDRSNLQQDPSISSRLRTCHLYGVGAPTVRQTSFTGSGVLRIGSRATPLFVGATDSPGGITFSIAQCARPLEMSETIQTLVSLCNLDS